MVALREKVNKVISETNNSMKDFCREFAFNYGWDSVYTRLVSIYKFELLNNVEEDF